MFALSQELSPNRREERRNDARETEKTENRKGNKLESHAKRYAPFAKNQPVRKKYIGIADG